MIEKTSDPYEPILKADAKAPPAVRVTAARPADGVIDDTTFRTIEVDRLFDAVNHARTRIGQATLYRSLRQPLHAVEQVRAKQEAVQELENKPALRKQIEALVSQAATLENDFYQLLYGSFIGMLGSSAHELELEGYGYDSYRKGTQFMLDLVKQAKPLPTPESPYLKTLVEDIRNFATSRAHALMHGPVYRTERGVRTRAEKGFFTPGIRFKPSLFKPVGITVAVLLVWLALEFAPFALGFATAITPVIWLFLLPLSLVYIPIVGGFDRDGCIYPLRELYKRSGDVHITLDSLGKLDELLSFDRFAQAFGSATVLPAITDSDQHVMEVQGARNPVVGKANPAYVPNDIELKKVHLTFITGPNSGGKTAFCKTLAQIQLLAQIGCYVPAERAELSVADRIFYQVPEASTLGEGEGRFGTELKRTKEIFLASTSRSLVILDELSEGTTTQEKMEISINILNGFYKKGNNTILITHNHELVDFFIDQAVGLARQVEFVDDEPTYRLIDGISRISHAHRIARKIGFAKEDIERHLTEKGA
jgi:DNA mismatch repair protein MutS